MKKSLETDVRKRAKYEKIQDKTLLIIARLTSQSGRLMFVPDEALIRRLKLKEGNNNPAYKIREAFRKLNQKNLIMYRRTPYGWSARLTSEGKRYAKKLELLDRIKLEKPAKWDKRWRVVIFDIWERRRPVRDKLRIMLKKAGFYKIQNSVWAYPYDCEELIAFLKVEMRLGSGVLYMIVEGIEQNQKIQSYFGLK